MKVALFNVKFSPNLGDGLLSECLEDALERNGGIEVRSIDLAGRTTFSSGNALRGPILSVMQHLPRLLRYPLTYLMLSLLVRFKLQRIYAAQLADVDAVVVGGGNIIADSDLNFPLKIAGALREVKQRGLPVAVFGVGVGDSWSQAGKAALRQAFANADLVDVTVRDQRSRGIWNRLFASDVIPASSLARDPGLLTAIRYGVSAPPRGGPIGLCLTNSVLLRYHAIDDEIQGDVHAWFRDITLALVAKGHRTVLFTNGSPEDRHLRDAIGPALVAEGGGAVSCSPDVTTPGELVQVIADCSLVIAHRMHACIAAHAIGIPTIGLSWDPKLDSFFALAGRSDFIVTPNRTPVEAVMALVDRALSDPFDTEGQAALVAQGGADVNRLAALLAKAVGRRG